MFKSMNEIDKMSKNKSPSSSFWSNVKSKCFRKYNTKVSTFMAMNEQDDSHDVLQDSLHQLAKNGDEENLVLLLESYKRHSLMHKSNANGLEIFADVIEKTIQHHKHQQDVFEIKINAKDELNLTALHYATKYNHFAIVKVLVDYGADVNATNDEGVTPLHFVARSRRFMSNEDVDDNSSDNVILPDNMQQLENIVIYLIVNKADPNKADSDGMTPLHFASIRGNLPVAMALTKHSNLNINAKDSKRQTPLHVASFYGHHRLCDYLLHNGATLLETDERQCNPLHWASSEGRIEVAKIIVKFAENMDTDKQIVQDIINQRNIDQATPLLLAVEHGKYDVVQVLLQNGADVNVKRNNGDGVLHLACLSRNVETLVKILIESGAEIDCQNIHHETPLHVACAKNRFSTAETFLSKGANVELKNIHGATPLLVAASCTAEGPTKAQILQTLLNAKADVFASDSLDRNAMFLACQSNNFEALKVLLRDPRGKKLIQHGDRLGNTPLHVASNAGYAQIVKFLLKYGAEPRNKNEEERSAVHLAAINNHDTVAALLIDHDRKTIYSRDSEGDTPLHCACRDGQELTVHLLLKKGAPFTLRNSHQKTPLDCAAEMGKIKVVEILLNNGATVEISEQSNTTALHLAAKEGHDNIVSLLLNRGTAIDILDSKGRNCLDLAIDHDHEDVAMTIVKHPCWKKALRHSRHDEPYYGRCTPMRQLIIKLPNVAREVFNQSIVTNGKVREHPSFEIQYNYEFIDDTYCNWEKPECTIVNHCHSSIHDVNMDAVDGFDSQGVMSLCAQPYSKDAAEIRMNHPLMIMVLSEREELLGHPLVVNLLHHKWKSYGKYVYYIGLILYLSFVLFLTNYISSIDAPLYFKVNSSQQECLSVRLYNQTEEQKSNFLGFSDNNKQWVSRLFMIITVLINVCKEIFQMFTKRLRYCSIGNVIELSSYLTTILFVADFDKCNRSIGLRSEWQWQVGAVAVFLAWINLVLYVRKFPHLGIYVVMLWDVLKTFARFFVVFFLLIVAFATTFYALLKNQPAFSTLPKSIVKTLVMMVGEYDFVNLFHPSQESFKTTIFYNDLSIIFFSIFVIVMTILIMNLLVGLAVDDIKSVQDTAVLKRFAMQIELVLEIEQVAPEFFRRRWIISKQTKRPNYLSRLETFMERHWLSSKSLRALAEPLYDIKTSKLELEVGDLKGKHETLQTKMAVLNDSVDKLSSQQSRILHLTEKLLIHLNVASNDDDNESIV